MQWSLPEAATITGLLLGLSVEDARDTVAQEACIDNMSIHEQSQMLIRRGLQAPMSPKHEKKPLDQGFWAIAADELNVKV